MHSRYRTVLPLVPSGISVPIQNPFNPFTVADATLIYNGAPVPVTTGVRFSAINDEPVRTAKSTVQDMLFDVGLRGELGEVGDYFKSWNWELGFRYSRNEQENLSGGVVSKSGLRAALLDTNPATAFNPFLGFFGRNSPAAISRVYVNSAPLRQPLSCLWAISLSTAICSIFPLGRSPSRSGLNTVESGGRTIPTRRTQRLTRSAPAISKLSG